ncbi:MAG: hypothetical protein IJF69_03985 [Clostridia bacterium]|nr:hypothetical protein [Clostridia bacterium]
MKKLTALLLVCVLMLSLSGCGFREFLAVLGFDTHDYDGEPVLEIHKTDSEVALELADMVKILTVNSVNIPEFYGTKEGVEVCRDAILNSMYSNNFAKYAGNSELFKEAMDRYPQMHFSVLIPADDFENIAYKYFGGKEKITNESSNMYTYVEDIDAYITATIPFDCEMMVNVQSVEETENTYRLEFDCTVGEDYSGDYFALIIKRPDDSLYFKYVEKR